MGVSIGWFIKELYKKDAKEGIQKDYGHGNGYLHDEEMTADRPLVRADAARIVHLYLKEKGYKDISDIEKASVLRDLYDCRVCVNHIAQVYLRGIMEPYEIDGISDTPFLIFDSGRKVSKEEAQRILKNI